MMNAGLKEQDGVGLIGNATHCASGYVTPHPKNVVRSSRQSDENVEVADVAVAERRTMTATPKKDEDEVDWEEIKGK